MTYSDNFKKAVNLLLSPGIEGGFSNEEWDNGGMTKFGISKRAYPNIDIQNLTREQAIQIYHNDYWNRLSCDSMPYPIALAVFDSAVNQGQGKAAKFLQLALEITADGVIGPKTLARVKASNHKKTLIRFMAERAVRYPEYEDWEICKKGWMRRLFTIMSEGNGTT